MLLFCQLDSAHVLLSLLVIGSPRTHTHTRTCTFVGAAYLYLFFFFLHHNEFSFGPQDAITSSSYHQETCSTLCSSKNYWPILGEIPTICASGFGFLRKEL